MRLSRINIKAILLYYSTFLATILTFGGFYRARAREEIIANLLFLPIFIFLWILLIQKRRERKGPKEKTKKKSKTTKRWFFSQRKA